MLDDCGRGDIVASEVQMKIALGADHAGYPLKAALHAWLTEHGYEVLNLGTDSTERVDYPDFGAAVGRAVAVGDADFGVAVCGSGQGICMAANKVSGVRAAILRDDYDAQLSRQHNDANVACFGGRVTTEDIAIRALETFLTTAFEGGRHQGRVELLAKLDADQDS